VTRLASVAALARARRGGFRRYLGVGLMLGIIGGLALFALAGARRVQSEYPRILAAGRPSNLLVTSNGAYSPTNDAAIEALPGVEQSRTFAGLETYVLVNGRPKLDRVFEGTASVDGLYFDQDRFLVVHGRLPDPHRVDEVAVNEIAASSSHFHVGERVEIATYSFDQYTSPTFAEAPPQPAARQAVTIVGTGLFPNEVVQDDADQAPRMLFTPALDTKQRELL
jgi:hypothetical protein